jgi:hypothetical protein
MATLLTQALTVIECTSTLLALALFYLFFKIYRLKKSPSLFGLPLGFLLLAISYFLFVVAYFGGRPYFSNLMWLRVVMQSWAFALIAFSYFLSDDSSIKRRYHVLSLLSWSLVLLMCFFGLLCVIYPVCLASVFNVNGIFAILNLALLTYIGLFLIHRLEQTSSNIPGLISTPIAFALLWLGQFCFFIWDNDGTQIGLVTSHIARLIGLLIFIRSCFLMNRRPKAGESQ